MNRRFSIARLLLYFGLKWDPKTILGGDTTAVLRRTSKGHSQSMEACPEWALTASLRELFLSTLALPFGPSSWSSCQWLLRTNRKARLEPLSTEQPGTFRSGMSNLTSELPAQSETGHHHPSAGPNSVWSVYGYQPTLSPVPSIFSANLYLFITLIAMKINNHCY